MATFGLMPAFGLAFFFASSAVAVSLVRDVPAFNSAARLPHVDGSGTSPHAPSMYDKGQYLYQRAYGLSNAGMLHLISSGFQDPADAIQVGIAGRREALDSIRMSLQVDPANAYAWQLYAELLLATDLPASRAAMLRANARAPNMLSASRDIALYYTRLRLMLQATNDNLTTLERAVERTAKNRLSEVERRRLTDLSALQVR